jgi:transposase-like protein
MSTAPPSATTPPASTSKSRARVNWTAAERIEWLALFEKSDQTVAEFCRANGLPPATLSYWRQQQGAGADGDELVEIAGAAVLNATGSKPLVTIRLPGGIALEVSAEADPVWLGSLVKNLTVRT